MHVLALFSNPPGKRPLRLDRESDILDTLAREHPGRVVLERRQATELVDAHALIRRGSHDVIHFSGHGDDGGIHLDKTTLNSGQGELVSAERLVSLIALAQKTPLLVVFLCCYSDDALDTLVNSAPFVITARCQAVDEHCLEFTRGFYEHLFAGNSVQGSFEHAKRVLVARGKPTEAFRLSRRSLIQRGNSVYVESTPVPGRDSLLVNLDAVKDRLGMFGMSQEQLLHDLARKLRVHFWIFDSATDHAIIPVGERLFGEFSWTNARDVVFCTRLIKIRGDVNPLHYRLWSTIIVAYNDMAACGYRSVDEPASPANRALLNEGLKLFGLHLRKLPAMANALAELGFGGLALHAELALASLENAELQFSLERYPQAVSALESALTNMHNLASGLLPPEELPGMARTCPS